MPSKLSESLPDQAGSIRSSPLVGPYAISSDSPIGLVPGLQNA